MSICMKIYTCRMQPIYTFDGYLICYGEGGLKGMAGTRDFAPTGSRCNLVLFAEMASPVLDQCLCCLSTISSLVGPCAGSLETQYRRPSSNSRLMSGGVIQRCAELMDLSTQVLEWGWASDDWKRRWCFCLLDVPSFLMRIFFSRGTPYKPRCLLDLTKDLKQNLDFVDKAWLCVALVVFGSHHDRSIQEEISR